MYAARHLVQPLWQTARISLRKCSSETPAVIPKKRSVLGRLGRGVAGLAVGGAGVGCVYYVTSDDLTKRQMKVTVQGVNRFIR